MPMMERPQVREIPGGKYWEHTFDKFELKAYVPDNSLDGQVNNYGFRAPCLLVFEENRQDMDSAVRFANETGLAKIAADFDMTRHSITSSSISSMRPWSARRATSLESSRRTI